MTPETVIAWRRRKFREHWTKLTRAGRIGRPALATPGEARPDWQIICDVSTRMGYPMHYADAVGLDQVYERICEFRDTLGPENWTPAPLLAKLAKEKMSLAEWAANSIS